MRLFAEKTAGPRPAAAKRVSVTVNERPVVFNQPDTTGAAVDLIAAPVVS